MTLQKAIQILSLAAYSHALTTGPDFYDALKLCIEAGKHIQKQRQYGFAFTHDALPGETKELKNVTTD